MKKKYLAKIIAKDYQGLQVISACCANAKININEIKYLPKNRIFLLSLKRFEHEKKIQDIKINSICKFEFVDSVKSKNINQEKEGLELELLAIDVLKNKKNYEINLIFSKNSYITLSTEIIETTLEDQNIDI
jgi:hypothetical protein|tara:strand:+ start:271 stop:666 length:396 start_codon:yes stop_codon:yes gene_type:complete